MDLYILGIGGTFMGHLALLAKQLGLSISGCDQHVYSPMREMLLEQEILFDEGYDVRFMPKACQCYVVGNVIARGNPMIEEILNQQLPMISGPQWLYEKVLYNKWVIAVAGTHGKTTTTSMISWILKTLGYKPGYLIGGAAKGFATAAELGDAAYFVIEADEYDTAFFDKRSKFIHYRPTTLIMNNLEFDHADIFQNIDDIKKTFHHLVRIMPSQGRVIYPIDDTALTDVMASGCWSESFGIRVLPRSTLAQTNSCQRQHKSSSALSVRLLTDDASQLEFSNQQTVARLHWSLIGVHNAANAVAALAAVDHIGVSLKDGVRALETFIGVARRMDVRLSTDTVRVYDDFAHHPTAIKLSLQGLRAQVQQQKIIAIIEPRSNTMTMGVHQDTLYEAVSDADEVYWLTQPNMGLDVTHFCQVDEPEQPHFMIDSATALLNQLMARKASAEVGQLEHWLCMSNGAFDGLFQLIDARFKDKSQ